MKRQKGFILVYVMLMLSIGSLLIYYLFIQQRGCDLATDEFILKQKEIIMKYTLDRAGK